MQRFLLLIIFGLAQITYLQAQEMPNSISNKTVAKPAPNANLAPPPPPPPPPPIRCGPEIFRTAEIMPRFPAPACEQDGLTNRERKECSDTALLKFVYDNLQYPKVAIKNDVEGTCVVQFIITENGAVTDAKVVRDIGARCGAEALRIVELMVENDVKWIPGTQRGRPVQVLFNLPVKFELPVADE